MRIARFIRREVAHGTKGPRTWRIAWYEPRRGVDVYSPAPLHRVLRFVRELCHRLRAALAAPKTEVAEMLEMQRTLEERQHLADEFSRGYLAGWRECFQACLAAVDELSPSDDEWALGELLADSVAAKQQN